MVNYLCITPLILNEQSMTTNTSVLPSSTILFLKQCDALGEKVASSEQIADGPSTLKPKAGETHKRAPVD